jgi:hypothetical protein
MRNPGDDDKINDVKDRWGNCKEGSIELKGLRLKSLSAVLGAYRAETERLECKSDVCRWWRNGNEYQKTE